MTWIPNSPVLEREMEVYAAFLEHTDHHVGRLIDALGPVLDDTLVYVMIGDNGASAEGTLQGVQRDGQLQRYARARDAGFMMSKLDEFGGEGSYGHYAVGWAWAMDSPYQWTKQVASHWGGTRNGTIVHWPAGIKDKGGVRNQFSHVIDVARPCSRRPASQSRRWSPGPAEPVRGHEHAVQLQRRRSAGAA